MAKPSVKSTGRPVPRNWSCVPPARTNMLPSASTYGVDVLGSTWIETTLASPVMQVQVRPVSTERVGWQKGRSFPVFSREPA
jgi:hypothetical protein